MVFARLPEPTTIPDNDLRGYFHQLLRVLKNGLDSIIGDISILQKGAFENTIVVKQASDLSNIDSTKHYMLDGVIDMGTQSIEVPAGGLFVSGLNGARDVSKLVSTENNYTLFTSPSGGYSGDIILENCTVTVSGTNSKVFDLDNDGNGNSLDITSVNFLNCTSLGSLTDYRQLLTEGVAFFAPSDGLTFNGTWTGITLVTTIAINFPAATTLLKEGVSFTVSNVRTDMNFLSVDASSILCNFDEANISVKGGCSLTNVRTVATNAMPNLPGSSTYARYRNCLGIRNTYVGGQWKVSSEVATALSGVSVGVPLKIAGTTTYADLTWFTQSTNNAFVYDGSQTIDVEVKGNLSFSGTNGDVIDVYVRQWDDSASSYVNLSKTGGSTMNSAGRAESISFNGIGTLDNNDRIELWVSNTTAARDVTALLDGYVVLSERQN